MAIFSVALLAVGCGQKTAETGSTAPANNAWTVANDTVNTNTDSAANTDAALSNNGEVAVDASILQLAQCINDGGVKMYGTEWCGHCKTQKAMFGDAFSYIDYTDCDADKNACVSAGVKGFPTWIDTKGNAYPGTQELSTLARAAGCEYAG